MGVVCVLRFVDGDGDGGGVVWIRLFLLRCVGTVSCGVVCGGWMRWIMNGAVGGRLWLVGWLVGWLVSDCNSGGGGVDVLRVWDGSYSMGKGRGWVPRCFLRRIVRAEG